MCQIEKAVKVHRAHLQQRTKTGKFIKFDIRRETPRGESGRFVKRLTDRERAEAQVLAGRERGYLSRQLFRHLNDLLLGRLDSDEAAQRGTEAIAEYYERMYRCGLQAAGNPGIILTARDKSVLSQMIRDESDYWRGFMRDAMSGKGEMEYTRRCNMYVDASMQPYWTGFIIGDLRRSRKIWWKLSQSEHCGSCVRLNQNDKPWNVRDFVRECLSKGLVPKSGELDCMTNCNCSLVEV